jgi:molybdenum cofactor cytidylyltransferase
MAGMDEVAALVLAAGLSRRMGQPKMLLPWGSRTVLGQVLYVLEAAGVRQRWVIGGAAYERIVEIAHQAGAECLYNAQYAEGEMLLSIQLGLRALEGEPHIQAALICLGDQPQIEAQVVRRLLQEWEALRAPLLVPSYQGRRGHPWLIARPLWAALLELQPPQTARHFLRAHAAQIQEVAVETDSILQDIDTPQEYERFRPRE